MFERVSRLFIEGRIDISGLDRAISFKWITEDEKKKIIDTKTTTTPAVVNPTL